MCASRGSGRSDSEQTAVIVHATADQVAQCSGSLPPAATPPTWHRPSKARVSQPRSVRSQLSHRRLRGCRSVRQLQSFKLGQEPCDCALGLLCGEEVEVESLDGNECRGAQEVAYVDGPKVPPAQCLHRLD